MDTGAATFRFDKKLCRFSISEAAIDKFPVITPLGASLLRGNPDA